MPVPVRFKNRAGARERQAARLCAKSALIDFPVLTDKDKSLSTMKGRA
jgi:hypothetical protein